MPTCYLDYDGVLHHENVARGPRRSALMQEPGRSLFEWAPVLVAALQPYPDVTIVLTTSWVRVLGFDRSKAYLPSALRERVVGATFHRREHGPTRDLRESWAQLPRGVQVAQDVGRRRPRTWFAIDDAVEEFSPFQVEWLVACDGTTGLGAPNARERLREMVLKVHALATEASPTLST